MTSLSGTKPYFFSNLRGFVAWMLVSEDCPVQRISCDAHADRTSEFQHAVEHLDRDFDLTHATRVFT